MQQTDPAFALDERLLADTHHIGDLDLSRVLLMNDARFPWIIVVPRRPNIRELIELSHDDQHVVLDEVSRCARVLRTLDQPDKLNIAALGNVVAQLHVHVIARRTTDAAWPRPVWNVGKREPYTGAALDARVAAMRAALHPIA
jgi:diadenosine tetraphosphate (Ap4A) HIT family hydrolase